MAVLDDRDGNVRKVSVSRHQLSRVLIGRMPTGDELDRADRFHKALGGRRGFEKKSRRDYENMYSRRALQRSQRLLTELQKKRKVSGGRTQEEMSLIMSHPLIEKNEYFYDSFFPKWKRIDTKRNRGRLLSGVDSPEYGNHGFYDDGSRNVVNVVETISTFDKLLKDLEKDIDPTR